MSVVTVFVLLSNVDFEPSAVPFWVMARSSMTLGMSFTWMTRVLVSSSVFLSVTSKVCSVRSAALLPAHVKVKSLVASVVAEVFTVNEDGLPAGISTVVPPSE